ncbi:MAG TPA: glycosyltransferase family 4 protein [Candidatus Kapabacteria bacterium]|nr:glycosyltransferase family 4 protein [Candidatus Kapabacteria bacterium]
MKNLLIIAYYFPPSGGPGVQRVLKHTQYLSEFGYNPIILTVENGQFPAKDETLLKKIPENILVYRTKIYEPYDLYRMFTGKEKGAAVDVNVIHKDGAKLKGSEVIAEFIRSTFFIPDARIGWLLTAKSKALELVEKYNIEAVYSSSPPYTCSLIARYVKRKKNIPWIAGFRDPWTDFISTPKRWFLPKLIDKAMEHSVFKEADYVEVAWEGISKDALSKYPDLNESKFIHIPNGFDSNDFTIATYPKSSKFILTYTGSMYGRRNPEALFKAFNLLINNGEININDFQINFIGRFGNEIYQMIDNSGFKESINIIHYLPHSESIKELQKADVLLLIVDESKESEEIVPGKVYEYMGIKKPILAIAPLNSAIHKLLTETNTGLLAHQSDIGAIATNIKEYFEKWKNNLPLYSPQLSLINKYERKNAAKELANLLNQTLKNEYRL